MRKKTRKRNWYSSYSSGNLVNLITSSLVHRPFETPCRKESLGIARSTLSAGNFKNDHDALLFFEFAVPSTRVKAFQAITTVFMFDATLRGYRMANSRIDR